MARPQITARIRLVEKRVAKKSKAAGYDSPFKSSIAFRLWNRSHPHKFIKFRGQI